MHNPIVNHALTKKKPWVFIAGQQGAGKTHLLTHANLAPNIAPPNTPFWVNNEAVFVELPEDFSAMDALLTACKKHCPRALCQTAIWVVDVKKLQDTGNTLHATLTAMLRLTKTLKLTLVITQCDQLKGFNDFFYHLTPEERAEPMGYSLPNTDSSAALREAIDKNNTALIKQVGDRLIWRLHHEQSLHRRARLKDFPAQLEGLCHQLTTFVQSIPWQKNIEWHGVYLTSTQQHSESTELAVKNAHGLLSEKRTEANTLQTNKTYFVEQCVRQVLDTTAQSNVNTDKKNWRRTVAMPLAAACVFGVTALWHAGYTANIQALAALRQNRVAPQSPSLTVPWLPTLNYLAKNVALVKHYHLNRFRWIGFTEGAQLYQHTQQRYQGALTKNFLPFLGTTVTTLLRDTQANTLERYTALKVYLMLAYPKQRNTHFMQQWFAERFTLNFPFEATLPNALLKNLHNALLLNKPLLTPNELLIDKVRNTLITLPRAQRALMLLESQLEYSKPQYTTHKNIDIQAPTIPALYQANHFAHIYSKLIKTVPTLMQQEAWVLGNDTTPLTPAEKNQLIAQVRNQYQQRFSRLWATQLSKITLKQPTTLHDASDLIRELTQPHSDLMHMISTIINNTDLSQQGINQNQSVLFAQTLLKQQGQSLQIQHTLQALTTSINTILAKNNTPKASYDAAVIRFKRNGKNDAITALLALSQKVPAPFNQWLRTIALGTWSVILNNTDAFLNKTWQASVMPDYHNNIDNKFPIDANATRDIDPTNFTAFFGPDGTIETFFNYFIKPFVNVNKTYWTWKSVNGKTLGLSQKTLEMFMRASMIQQMFFTDDATQPSFDFTLTPISLAPNTRAFRLNIDGTRIAYSTHTVKSSNMSWPGPNPGLVIAQFIGVSGDNRITKKSGTFALLRLLQQASLKRTKDPKQFVLTFKSGAYAATYQLTSDNRANPFLPDVLSALRFKDTL